MRNRECFGLGKENGTRLQVMTGLTDQPRFWARNMNLDKAQVSDNTKRLGQKSLLAKGAENSPKQAILIR